MSAGTGLVGRVVGALRSGWAVYLVAAALSRVGAIFLVPLYTRRLSPEEYGTYSLLVSLVALFPLVLSLGLTSIIAKAYFDAPDAQVARERVGTVGRWLMLLSGGLGLVLASLALVVWPDGLLSLSGRQVALAVAGSIGVAWSSVPEGFFRASRAARSAVTLQLANFFSTAGLGILFVAGLGRGLSGAIEAVALVGFGLGVNAALFVLRLGGSLQRGVVQRWLPSSLPFVAHFLASWVLTMGDRWVLSAMNFEAKLGTYYLAVQLVSPALMLVGTWNELDVARMGEQYREGGIGAARAGARRRTAAYLGVALVGALAVGIAVPLLPIVVGERFVGAGVYVPALLLAHLLESQYFVPANLLFYSGRTGFIPLVTVSAGVLNVGLAVLLLPVFGVAGLLGSRVVASATRSALMGLAAWRYARVAVSGAGVMG